MDGHTPTSGGAPQNTPPPQPPPHASFLYQTPPKAPKPPHVYDRLDALLAPVCWGLGFLLLEVFGGPAEPGLGLALLMLAYLGLTVWLNRKDGKEAPNWFLLIPQILLALCFALFHTSWLRPLNLLAFWGLDVIRLLLAGRLTAYPLTRPRLLGDALGGLFSLPLRHLDKPFGACKGLRKGWRTPLLILLGLLIGLPVLAVVTLLLASSDDTFARTVWDIVDSLTRIDIWTHVGRLLLGLLPAWALYSQLWSLRHGHGKPPAVPVAPAVDGRLPVTPALAALTPMALVYLLFLCLQFSYLFSGHPGSMSMSDYARRGFFELFAVAALNMAAVLTVLQVCRTRSGRSGLALRILCTVIAAQTGLLLVSSTQRMILYIAGFGMTTLRTVVMLCEVGILCLLVSLILKIWRPHFGFFKWFLRAAVTLLLVCNFMNINLVTAHYNVAAYQRGQLPGLDTAYLLEQSPVTLTALSRLPEGYADLRGTRHRAELACSDWRSWSLDDWLAATSRPSVSLNR